MSFCFQFRASRYITGLNRISEFKVIVVFICCELLFSISSIPIYYGTKSDIRVKSYCGLHLSFCFEFLASRYIMGHNRTSELKVIVVCICYELSLSISASWYITGLNRTSEKKVIVVWICYVPLFGISSVSIYYGTQSDIRVKSYFGLNFQRAFVFNYERLDILWDAMGYPTKNLFSFEFATRFCFQLRASQYTTGHNRTSE